MQAGIDEMKRLQELLEEDQKGNKTTLQEILKRLGTLIDTNCALEGRLEKIAKEKENAREEAKHWQREADAWKDIAKREMTRREDTWQKWEERCKQLEERLERAQRDQEWREGNKEREGYKRQQRKQEEETRDREEKKKIEEEEKEERLRVETEARQEELEREVRRQQEQLRNEAERRRRPRSPSAQNARHYQHQGGWDRHRGTRNSENRSEEDAPQCSRPAPRRLTDSEWAKEREDREKRKRNLYVEGLGYHAKEAPQKLRELLWEGAKMEVSIKATQVCGRGLVFELDKMSEKVEIIKSRGIWRGSMRFEDDLTYREKEVQDWLEAVKREEEGRGKRVLVGHQKIQVNGVWWYWYEGAGSLKEGETKQVNLPEVARQQV